MEPLLLLQPERPEHSEQARLSFHLVFHLFRLGRHIVYQGVTSCGGRAYGGGTKGTGGGRASSLID